MYFLLMSIAPFILWLTLVFGSVDTEQLLSSGLFESISPVLRYLKESAESAVGGCGDNFSSDFAVLVNQLFLSPEKKRRNNL